MCNCPECGSNNVQVQTDEEQLRSYYHCCDCGKEWSRAGINRKGDKTPKPVMKWLLSRGKFNNQQTSP